MWPHFSYSSLIESFRWEIKYFVSNKNHMLRPGFEPGKGSFTFTRRLRIPMSHAATQNNVAILLDISNGHRGNGKIWHWYIMCIIFGQCADYHNLILDDMLLLGSLIPSLLSSLWNIRNTDHSSQVGLWEYNMISSLCHLLFDSCQSSNYRLYNKILGENQSIDAVQQF